MCGYRYVLDLKHSTYSKYHNNYEQSTVLVAQENLKLWAKAGISQAEIDRERQSLLFSNTLYCIENLFKRGTPLSLPQQYGEVKRLLFADETVLNAIRRYPNPTRSKSFALFRLCALTRSALLVTLLYWLIDRVKRMM